MVDDQKPTDTPAVPTQSPVPSQPVPAPVAPQMSFLEKFDLPANTLWQEYRVFFIIFGILILVFKFRSIIMDLLISDSKKTVNDAQKQDTKLKTEENQANDQANQLRKESDDLSKNKPTVGEDWNKK